MLTNNSGWPQEIISNLEDSTKEFTEILLQRNKTFLKV